MGLLNPMFESVFLKSAVLLAIVASSGVVPEKLVAAQTAAANKVLGFANKELANVKEGTVITVHGEGDDNITVVQIGVPAKKTDKAPDAN